MLNIQTGSIEERELWQRIAAHPFENKSPLDFQKRLCREQRWNLDYGLRVIEEYRRFVFLSCVSKKSITPSIDVDEVWHLHLTYTEDYWNIFCPQVLQQSFHHRPTTGSKADAFLYLEQYARTLQIYKTFFGRADQDIWPGSRERFYRPARFQRLNRDLYWIIPKPWKWMTMNGIKAPWILLGFVIQASPVHAHELNPFDWPANPFLGFFALTLGILCLISFTRKRAPSQKPRVATERLTPHHLAILTGGLRRAVQSAFTQLLVDGVLVWNPETLRYDPQQPDSDHRIVQQLQGGATMPTILSRMESEFLSYERDLEAWGLLWTLDEQNQQRFRASPGYFLLVIIGIIRCVLGVSRDKPIGFLVILLAFSVLIWGLFAKSIDRLTQEGHQLLENCKQEHEHMLRAPLNNDLPMAVALLGPQVLIGTAYSEMNRTGGPGVSYGDGSGSDGMLGGGGDSGCGSSGGDGGGSGCGGCGGGD